MSSVSFLPASSSGRTMFSHLQGLDWSDEANAIGSTEEVLRSDLSPESIVRNEFQAWRDGQFYYPLNCRETATHWKWFVGGDPAGPQIWIHEYKPRGERRPGYADSIHDHRYSFCSALVRGGYRHVVYSVQSNMPAVVDEALLVSPWIHSVDADVVHSVSDIVDSTLTLIVQGPPRRHFSTEYRTDGAPPQKHWDFHARVRAMKV